MEDELNGENTRFTPMYRSGRRNDYFAVEMRSANIDKLKEPNREIVPLPPNFSRLYKSLLSGLPNEFDLGVSSCLALSLNDSRIPLHPQHFSMFIDILCAHAGVFGSGLYNLFLYKLSN